VRRIPLILASALATLLLALQPSAAFAAQPKSAPTVETFWTGSFGYEGFAVSHRRISATSCVAPYELQADGTFELRAFPRPGCWELRSARGTGTAFSRDGSELGVLYTHGLYPHGFLSVYRVGASSYTPRHTAGFFDLESLENPDRNVSYGFVGGEDCSFDSGAPLPRWTGATSVVLFNTVTSVAPSRRNSWLVADAAANTIWKVDANGTPSTFSLLPRVRVRVTAELAATNGWPACAVGLRYYDEPRPYEVETGRDGKTYVAAGAGLYRLNPRSGHVRKLRHHFDGRLDLAVGRHGLVYVAELATGQISVISHGRVRPYVKVPDISTIETDEHGGLWAAVRSTYDGNEQVTPGRILRIGQS